MKSGRLARFAAIAGAGALVGAGVLTACGEPQQAPETTTPNTTVTPTEKSIDPTGGNLFTPTVKATPPPTALPGDHHYR